MLGRRRYVFNADVLDLGAVVMMFFYAVILYCTAIGLQLRLWLVLQDTLPA